MVINHENNAPKVSVIMPCYNNADFLKDSIDSVLNQNYPNIELIVIDDGSTDDSLKRLKEYGDKIILLQQKNQGPAAARNYGIREATGDYIAFNDSDDLWLPGKLLEQINFLRANDDFIACYCNWDVWDGNSHNVLIQNSNTSVIQGIQDNRSGWLYLPLLKDCIIHTISIVIRKDISNKVGFFEESFKVGEDHDYWIRLSRIGKIAKLQNTFALYRSNLSSTTNKIHPHNYSLQVLEKNVQQFGLSDPDGNTLPIHTFQRYVAERHFTYGYQCFWGGERHKARDSFIGCIKNKNFLLKSIIYVAITSIPPLFKLVRHLKSK